MEDLKLRDIKDIVEIPDNSLFELLSLVGGVVALLIVGAILFLIYKKFKNRRRKPTKKELALEELKSIDFSNSKESAYKFSRYGYLWVDEHNRNRFFNIERDLEKYKYKRDVPPLEDRVKEEMREFIEELG
jgi:flagellar biosynthesis/type III secretory pathway M-ring protein FliF/YscJ